MPGQNVLNLIIQLCWTCLTVIDTQIYHYSVHSFRENWKPLCAAVFKWLSKLTTPLRLLRLVIGLKVSRQFFNQWEAKPIVLCGRDFPALWAFYRQLPRILIGSLDRLLLSWLVAVITLILIFRHLFENRLIMQLIFQEILASHSSSLSNLNSLSLMSAKTSWLFLRAFLYLSWYFVSSVDNSSRRVVTSVLKFLLSSYLKEIQSKPKGKKVKINSRKESTMFETRQVK